jgi:hypothetical protein
MIERQVDAHNNRNPGQKVLFGWLLNQTTDSKKYTLLDWAINSFENNPMGRGADAVDNHQPLKNIRHKDAVKCYKYLRTRGALHSFELNGHIAR